jgi:hypothetical protein
MYPGDEIMRFYPLFLILFMFGCEKDSNFLYEDLTPPRQERDNRYVIADLSRSSGIDILFVLDDSGSMSSIHNNIVDNAELFMEEFTKIDLVQWKMGIVTSEKYDSTREITEHLGFDSIFNSYTPNAVQVFKDAVLDVGDNSGGTERMFGNLDRALKERYNDFLRPNSQLAVILVSDEKEHSYKDDAARYDPITFAGIMKAYLSKGNLVRFYGALKQTDFPDCTNLSWDSGPYKGSRYEAIIQETGGFAISACAKDFGTRLADIGRDIVSLSKYIRIKLGERPLKESIKVLYRGVELPFGTEGDGGYWFYDEYNNTVNLYSLKFAQDLNDELQITYEIDDGYNRDKP